MTKCDLNERGTFSASLAKNHVLICHIEGDVSTVVFFSKKQWKKLMDWKARVRPFEEDL